MLASNRGRAQRAVRLVLSVVAVAVAATALGGGTSLASGQPNNRSNSPSNLVPWGWPKQVIIPRIGVRAPLEDVRLDKQRDEEAPFQWNDAAWYSRGARPGDVGRAFVFGHLDSTCCPAVFWNIHELNPGDTIQVQYRDGRVLTFRVVWQHTYLNQDIPMNWIFGPARQRGLVLYTCAGIFHTDGTGYDHKLIVWARMVMPNGRLG